MRGPPGIGKTALLDWAIAAAGDMTIARVAGVEAELDLPYAALHQLLRPFLNGLDDLPGPQRDALAATVGLVSAKPADRLLVALAALTLLSNASDRGPLLCAVDDAEWLDGASAQALSFVARRVDSDGLAMLFTVDGTQPAPVALEGLPELRLEALRSDDARELLEREVAGELDNLVRDHLIGESGGNPLALIELAHSLTPEQLSGASPLPEALPLGEALEEALIRKVRTLSPAARDLLLLVAAERSGEPDLLGRATASLGLPSHTLEEAESMLRLGPRITFRHDFVRSAVYATASEGARRRAHLALAAAMDPVADEDRAAWHRAAAATDADEIVATDLELSAPKARERGGHAAAAAVLELAARRSETTDRRAERLLAAADARLASGDVGRASVLVRQASPDLLDNRHRAEAQRLQAAVAMARGEDAGASTLLLEAARALEPFDGERARTTYLEALTGALFVGRLATDGPMATVSSAIRSSPTTGSPEGTAANCLLNGFAALYDEGPAAAATMLRRGVDLALDRGGPRTVGLAFLAAFELWDERAIRALAKRRVDLERELGALLELPNALSQLGEAEILVGRFATADACFREGRELAAATGTPGLLGDAEIGPLQLAAWRGQDSRARTLAHACATDGGARGFGAFVGFASYSLAILELGLGHYHEALTAAQDATFDPLLVTRAAPEVAEAAARAGERDVAEQAARRLAETVSATGTPWGLGMLARSQALLAGDAHVEDLYRESVDHLRRSRVIPQLARTRLLYGEWLRRQRRRRDARDELRVALDLFEGLGADAFADRARAELGATGEHVVGRRVATGERLTPHERRIAGLVSESASNAEIAAQLFVSPRTVEYHLGKIFRKLGITSRTEVARALEENRRERRNETAETTVERRHDPSQN